jgi:hypothetical protein
VYVRKSAPRVSGERKKEESQKIKIRTMSFQAKAQEKKAEKKNCSGETNLSLLPH